MMVVGRYWFGAIVPAAEISRSPRALPMYAVYSLVRMGVAYVLSLVFAVAYGYVAAYNKRLQGVMLATLDILQSIPVLSFLPGVMLAMVALFPARQLGVEIGSDRADLHRPGVEHGVQFLCLAEGHPAGTARGGRDLPLRPQCSASCNWNCRTARSA